MTPSESGRAVEVRDRLRVRLDILSEYDRVLRAQITALDEDDLDAFSILSDQRESLADQLASLETGEPQAEDMGDPLADDMTARLMAEIHMRVSELKVLDSQVLGALNHRRGEIRNEIERAAGPVSDGAVRYMEAESGLGGTDRLDVVL